MKQARQFPRVIVTKKAARALKGGHLWVYAGEVLRLEPAADGRLAVGGDVVDVLEENGTWQGSGLFSPASTLRVRIVSRNANDRFDDAFWRRRIRWSWEHRKTTMGRRFLPGAEPDTNCCRIVFSEADGLPGLVVDRYEDVLVTQVGTVGMERLRPVVYPLLLDVLADDGVRIRGIFERNDAPSRAKEGLEAYKGWYEGIPGIAGETSATAGSHVLAQENGVAYDIDLENSQKTGFFLDQKYNRRAVRQIADGRRVLDCFCHVGPFGLNALAGGASYVRFVDVSKTALDLARQNARRNGWLEDGRDENERVGFTCSNVLEYLPRMMADPTLLNVEGGPFDLIVLDPPAFTKSRRTIRNAARGYREVNEAALRLLPRGGYLATCSCSHFMTRDGLAQAVAEAAHGAQVQLKQVEERQQAPDHPILWGMSETHYLDFFVFQVV